MVEQERRVPDARITALQADMTQVKSDIASNTELTKTVEQNTREIVEFWKTAEAGLKVLAGLGKLAKWITAIATAVAAISGMIYAVTHWGSGPK